MKVLITFDWFLKIVVEGQAEELVRRGHSVRLLCRSVPTEFAGRAEERRAILDRLEADGIDTIEIPGRRYRPERLGDLRRAKSEVDRWAPDVVSAHENTDPRLLLISGPRRPIVFTYHDPEPHPGIAQPSAVERLALRAWTHYADLIVVHGEQLATAIRPTRYQRKSVVVPHGVPVRAEPLPKPPAPTVLFFGKLEPWKGLDVLMAAMGDVWRTAPDVRLIVAGQGPAAGQVVAGPQVDFREGYVPEADVPSLFAEATLTALPYRQIAQSGVGSLSASYGVPSVVTRVGALEKLILDDDYAADPGDAGSLTRALLHGLAHTDADRRRLIEKANAEFSWTHAAAEYEALYRRISGVPG